MREIKFRGKRLDNGKWIEGGYVQWSDARDSKYFQIVSQVGHHNDIDPTTVGQFTGLLDKNGKEIFEGDILQHTIHPQIYHGVGRDDYTTHKGLLCRYEVLYNPIHASYEIKLIYVSETGVKVGSIHKSEIAIGDRYGLDSIDGYSPKCKFMIIGNIHNPEQLKTE